jgi:hypothetical protein
MRPAEWLDEEVADLDGADCHAGLVDGAVFGDQRFPAATSSSVLHDVCAGDLNAVRELMANAFIGPTAPVDEA